jgi:uncharacterized membrane protein
MNENLNEIWERHLGKIVGAAAGLAFGCLILVFGFWRSIFVALCVLGGYVIGKRFDQKGSLKDLCGRFFPQR